jgi:predicted RNA-binding protein
MATTRDKVTDAASNVKPYVQRAISDEDLRDNVKAAFQTAREIYDELIGNRSVTTVATRVATDKEIQEKLKDAVDELRTAANRVQGKKEHSGRNATLLIAGIALGILFNPVTGPATRKWLADAVFGGDDFTYESPAGNGSAAPDSDSTAA